MKHMVSVLFVILFTAFTFTSCSALNSKSDSFNTSTSTPTPDTNFGKDENIVCNNLYEVNSSTSEGTYLTEVYNNTCIITYVDYMSQSQIPLCSNANCEHKDGSCPAIALAAQANGNLRILVFKDKLYFLQTTAYNGQNAKLYSTSLDGTNPQVICEFGSNVGLMGNVFSDGDYFYTLLDEIDPTVYTTVSSIVKIDLLNHKWEKIFTFEPNTYPLISAAYNRNLVFDIVTQSNQRICESLNVDSPFYTTDILTIDLDNPSKGFLFADDKLVVVNDDKKLEIKSLESGNTNIYSYEFLYDLYNIPEDIVPIVYNSFDDWFLMSFTLSDDTTLNLNWNPISGKCELQTLLQEYNSSPLSIYASSADFLFVKYNSKVETDGLQLTDVQPLYALIEKEDYLHSVANYKVINSFLVE